MLRAGTCGRKGVSVAPGAGEQHVLLAAIIRLSQEPWQDVRDRDLVAVSAGTVLADVGP